VKEDLDVDKILTTTPESVQGPGHIMGWVAPDLTVFIADHTQRIHATVALLIRHPSLEGPTRMPELFQRGWVRMWGSGETLMIEYRGNAGERTARKFVDKVTWPWKKLYVDHHTAAGTLDTWEGDPEMFSRYGIQARPAMAFEDKLADVLMHLPL
jgi:hypothetical protein